MTSFSTLISASSAFFSTFFASPLIIAHILLSAAPVEPATSLWYKKMRVVCVVPTRKRQKLTAARLWGW